MGFHPFMASILRHQKQQKESIIFTIHLFNHRIQFFIKLHSWSKRPAIILCTKTLYSDTMSRADRCHHILCHYITFRDLWSCWYRKIIAVQFHRIITLFLYIFPVQIAVFRRCCACKKDNSALKTSPFRDDWSLLLELSIIWVMWMVGIFGAFVFLPLRGQPIYPVLIVYLTMITRIIITLTMLVIPYNVSHRSNKKISKKISISMLKKVLSTKAYFYAFVEHLVHEMAIENLTALVEIWQFKYEHEYTLKPLKISKKINIAIGKSKEELSTSTTHTQEDTWYNTDQPTIAYESSYNLDAGLTPSPVDAKDVETMVQYLKSLRWNKLPLAQSIALNLSQTTEGDNAMDIHQKWKQCAGLLMKYFDERSYDSVNVSYAARYEVYTQYHMLSLYVCDSTDSNESGDFVAPPTIQNDDEFKERILKVFDVSIPDLVNNLQNSLTRFVLTDEFKVAR
eukprot:58586_1